MKEKKYLTGILFLLLTILVMAGSPEEIYAKAAKKEAPKNVEVARYKNRELKLTWKKVKDAEGYRIYRYNDEKGKYEAIQTIYGKNNTSYIDKNMKIHRIYRYKVACFEIKPGMKKFSRRSYWVSARTYGKMGKLVNSGVSFFGLTDAADEKNVAYIDGASVEVGICNEMTVKPFFETDDYTKNKKAKPVSEQLRWEISDESLAKISKNGKLTTFDKEGECYLYVRSHTGSTDRVKIKIKNYARPDSFPYYSGNNSDINLLLMEYKEEVFNIAEYFTKYCEKGASGVIASDNDGNITGIPDFKKISTIKKDINRLITDFPLVMKIYYDEDYVVFRMLYDVYGNSYCDVEYYKLYDYEGSFGSIAPHWLMYRKLLN